MNDLSSNIDHLDILHVIIFLVFANWYVSALVGRDSLLKVFVRAFGIFVLVVWSTKLQTHICLEQLSNVSSKFGGIEVLCTNLLVFANTFNEENTKLRLPLLDMVE